LHIGLKADGGNMPTYAKNNSNKNMKKITIAIDGFSSCGKSTMAKDLAKEIGYIYIDSGAMYRAVTLFALQQGIFTDKGIDTDRLRHLLPEVRINFRKDEKTNLPQTFLNGKNVEREIRGMEVSAHVSPIATLDFVRSAMVEQQQAMGREKGIVMDGRDIGTTVFPDAELKVYVTASPEIRAQRRFDELRGKGEKADFEEILQNVKERDHIDMTRKVSPLHKADDAIELDNSHLTVAQQKAWLMNEYKKIVEDKA
jgi:cytidylate kinase